jgi:uncharacterized protein
MTSTRTPITLTTTDGQQLDGDFAAPPASTGPPVGCVVLAHPHPLRGGNRRSPVIKMLFDGFADARWAVIRFDFRGVGRSTGVHGDGISERLDVAAALDHLHTEFPTLPAVLVGYSFGARVVLSVEDPHVRGWIAIAPPLAVSPPSAERDSVGQDPRPKRLIVPAQDDFSPPTATTHATAVWVNTSLTVVEGADHFFRNDVTILSQVGLEAVFFANRLVMKP